jgi:hypothetical protein
MKQFSDHLMLLASLPTCQPHQLFVCTISIYLQPFRARIHYPQIDAKNMENEFSGFSSLFLILPCNEISSWMTFYVFILARIGFNFVAVD